MILGKRLVEAPPVDYKHFIIELRRVGTNLNQLTAKANTIGFINRAECRVVLNDVRTTRNISIRTKEDLNDGNNKSLEGIGFFEKRSWTMQPIKIKQISKMNRS